MQYYQKYVEYPSDTIERNQKHAIIGLNNVIKVYEVDPLRDERWGPFLERHPCASVFHSREWLRALHRTYRYSIGALTTSAPSEPLNNALVFCRVRSWLTGPRIVSVPFSDHCAPLVDGADNLARLLSHLKSECDGGTERYLEIRSGAGDAEGMAESHSFCLHRIDLRPNVGELFHALHANCIRRKIARAQREGMTYEEGASEDLLTSFYQLTMLTRRRHKLPPQPLCWFRNLIASMGDKLKIRIASAPDRQPAAGILTLRHKTTMTYKYGCSDSHYHKLGPMQLLMWKAIQDAKETGLLEFDMGRTDFDNPGLLNFKDRWGGARSTLRYLQYPAPRTHNSENVSLDIAKSLFALAPSSVLRTAGNLLYPHAD